MPSSYDFKRDRKLIYFCVFRYGESDAKDFIPGAEVVDKELSERENNAKKRKRQDSEESGSDWEDVYHSSDEGDDDDEEEDPEEEKTSLEDRKAKATEITSTRILTDEDFKRIEAAQLRKQVQGFSKSKNKKRKLDEDNPLISSKKGREELVDLANIGNYFLVCLLFVYFLVFSF